MKRSRMNGGRSAALGALAALLAFAPEAVTAREPGGPYEPTVKAVFLTRFPAYVDWPAAVRPGPGAELRLCIVGDDPFGTLIDEAARGRRVDGHPLRVRRVGTASRAGGCHIAFVPGGAPAVLQALRGKPMLTVTDGPAGAQSGMIHFVSHQGRIRFTIDEAQAAASGIRISSRLLGIALKVRRS